MQSPIFLSGSADAVDAALMTKDCTVLDFATKNKVPLSRIAAIGDSANDLPFLKIPGLGMRGYPLNAQPAVKEALKALDNVYSPQKNSVEAFFEFYDISEQRGMAYVFADKDGVLVWRNDKNQNKKLSALFRKMGTESRPFVYILTGSSSEQNLDFVYSTAFHDALTNNPSVENHPFLLLAENGAIQINVLSGEVQENLARMDDSLLRVVNGDFRKQTLSLVDREVLPRFKLQWSLTANDQAERIWVPPKRTMLTLNLPKTFRDGRDYRASENAKELSSAIIDSMIKASNTVGLPYKVL